MEEAMCQTRRSEEQKLLLENWERRLYPLFLEMGLEFREFWSRGEKDGAEDPRGAIRDFRFITEMVTRAMYRGCFDARSETLESLSD
jgi:hypothetical protein